MSNLSEPGKLYLKDFFVLEEAREDLQTFLSSVQKSVKFLLEEYLTDNSKLSVGSEYNFEWFPPQSNSTWKTWIYPVNLKNDVGPFRQNKEDIWVGYLDITSHDAKYNKNVFGTSIIVESNVGNFRKYFNHLPQEKIRLLHKKIEEAKISFSINEKKIVWHEIFVELDLNSVEKSAEDIVEKIKELSDELEQFVKIIVSLVD